MSSLDEMATALGFVVGKKAGAQPGDRVTFALTDGGAVVREIHVEVVERAMVVDRLHLPATLVLTMPVGVMTRRCAGRVGPDDLRDQIVIDGDEDLAEKILRKPVVHDLRNVLKLGHQRREVVQTCQTVVRGPWRWLAARPTGWTAWRIPANPR